MANTCSICKDPIEPSQTAVVAIRGYQKLRDQGGGNAIKHREVVPNWIAHEVCLDARKRGDRDQLALI